MIAHALWIDDLPARVIRPGYWDELKRLGFDEAHLLLDTTKLGWDPQFTPGQVRQCAHLALDRDLSLALTVWPIPQRVQLNTMFADLESYLSLGVVELEVDCEGLWRRDFVNGYASLNAASLDLVRRMEAVKAEHDVRISLTTFAGHPEAQSGALVSKHLDRVNAQLYSTRINWRGERVAWDSRYGPGERQRLEYEKFKAIPADEDGTPPQICVGLAAWDQKWPGHTVEEAMDAAFEAALVFDPLQVLWWSSKWGVGARRQEDVRAWFERRIA